VSFDSHFLLFYSKQMTVTLKPQAALAGRLAGLARSVRALALLAAPLLLGVPPLLLWAPEALLSLGLGVPPGLGLMHLAQQPLGAAGRARMAAASLPPVLLSLALLWQLWWLFGEYLRGAVFSPRALACLRRFGALLLALAVAQPLSQALMSVAISWDNPPGQRMVMFGLSSNDYALMLCSLVFMAIARVMTEAARVAEENEGFV
jgi:hypothetical protein